jgi:hypothetical protein
MSKTVLVLGAGASKEALLPIGTELMAEIAQLLTFREEADDLTRTALQTWAAQHTGGDLGPLGIAAKQIATVLADSQAMSIDNYVDAHRGNQAIEACAKVAIARAILRAERRSAMVPDPRTGRLSFDHMKHTWYLKFAKLLRENCTANQLRGRLSQLAVIVFNYDRCFEFYLAHDLHRYYGMPLEEADDLVKSIEIYHPYGSVGTLPRWCGEGETPVPFGHEPDPSSLLRISGSLKTFAEQSVDASLTRLMRDLVAQARPLVFLGFAYWRMNLQLLLHPTITVNRESDRVCFGTALGMSSSNQAKLRLELAAGRALDPEMIVLSEQTCSAFIDEHQRWLSFA